MFMKNYLIKITYCKGEENFNYGIVGLVSHKNMKGAIRIFLEQYAKELDIKNWVIESISILDKSIKELKNLKGE